MAKEKKQNGKGFVEKLSLAQLRVEVLENRLDAQSIMDRYSITGYTLQNKLYQAMLADPKNAKRFLLEIPSDVSTRVERKKSITLTSALCEKFGIEVGSKFDVSKESQNIVLAPVK